MVYRLPPLNALRAFEAAARHMSFRDAADELHVTPSALSYQVRQLEDFLQIALFKRMNRRVALTDAGARVFPGVRDGFERLHEAMSHVTGATPDHILVVSTGPAFAAKWLTPRVYRFMEAHPSIEMRIAASLKLIDFVADEVDLGIRFGAGHYSDLHVELLAGEWTTPMASPQLLEARAVKTPDDLAKLPLLHDDSLVFSPGSPTWTDWFRHAGVKGVDSARGARFSHADHAIDAAIRGAGVVLGRSVIAADEVLTGRLVAPFPDLRLDTRLGFYLVCPRPALEREKVQAFREWITEEMARPEGQLA